MNFDCIICDGKIIDGTGNPWYRADIGIKDSEILEIGTLKEYKTKIKINAKNNFIAPGFIDIHSHSDLTYLVDPTASSKLTQGITTELIGNCGFLPAPVKFKNKQLIKDIVNFIDYGAMWNWESFSDYIERLESVNPCVNLAVLVGHSTLRAYVMGLSVKEPSAFELEQLKDNLSIMLDEGAFGLSTGLTFQPAINSKTNELIQLCNVVKKHNGFYATHIRERAGLLKGIKEAIQIGKEADIPVQISHLQTLGKSDWGKSNVVLKMLEKERNNFDITFDVYPYTAGSSNLLEIFPNWATQDGFDDLVNQLRCDSFKTKLKNYLEKIGESFCAWDKVFISKIQTKENRNLEGMNIHEIALKRGTSDSDTILQLLVEEKGKIDIVSFYQNKEDMKNILSHFLGAICTDGFALKTKGKLNYGKPHPRCYGSFPRFLSKFTGENGLITLEEGVRKITSLPAQRLGLSNRGLIKIGQKADIVIFDSKEIADTATFEKPHSHSKGIKHVLVNGEQEIKDGDLIIKNNRAGKILRHN